jgi:hypothetical protein
LDLDNCPLKNHEVHTSCFLYEEVSKQILHCHEKGTLTF